MTMLEVEGLSVSYGHVRAINDVSFSVKEGDLVSLIGANGAGKTTLLRAIMGGLLADAGSISLHGIPLGRSPVEERVRRGMYLVPEKRSLFNSMTVQDNLELGTYANRRQLNFAEEVKRIYSLFPILEERKLQLAGTLSGGQQQMVAIGRALIARPRVLLLDEPSIGLAPLVVQQIMDVIVQHKRQEGLTIVLVEQNARLALRAADHAYLIEIGKIVKDGAGDELANDPRLTEIYLGTSTNEVH
ncbi:ABC transporter ATP-binding protein [Candidimonas nitroreducens]|uniref:ABC transporter ATP-binding protein n=1 Tax=Candidimonas nitroreducens TaxID=683354 RepID=A0A225MJV3_9BURK|nr:ABC transporter ATP-binding protein [Candidimonas nitroreducens]OWT59189.1 ABC transporter ATP-binding protein [Candidimonas nitroreducens]